MSKNINFDGNDDDTEGHSVRMGDEPSFHVADAAPGVADDTDDTDDTEGHHIYVFGEEPSVSGALSTDPKTQS